MIGLLFVGDNDFDLTTNISEIIALMQKIGKK